MILIRFFVDPPQNELQTNLLEGKFGGIGIRLEIDVENHVLVYPLPDSPAAKAGVLDGDQLVAVDHLELNSETSSEDIQAAIRGPVGDEVRLTVFRKAGNETLIIKIIREEVPLPSVTWNLYSENSSVGLIQVNIIASTTPDEIENAVNDLKSKGAKYYVLDLRNNGGGLVDAGVKVVELFSSKGEILKQQYHDKPVETISTDSDGRYLGIPLAILINQNTASAAEIIAGSLQGTGRAIIIGNNSYGKDTVQLVFGVERWFKYPYNFCTLVDPPTWLSNWRKWHSARLFIIRTRCQSSHSRFKSVLMF